MIKYWLTSLASSQVLVNRRFRLFWNFKLPRLNVFKIRIPPFCTVTKTLLRVKTTVTRTLAGFNSFFIFIRSSFLINFTCNPCLIIFNFELAVLQKSIFKIWYHAAYEECATTLPCKQKTSNFSFSARFA